MYDVHVYYRSKQASLAWEESPTSAGPYIGWRYSGSPVPAAGTKILGRLQLLGGKHNAQALCQAGGVLDGSASRQSVDGRAAWAGRAVPVGGLGSLGTGSANMGSGIPWDGVTMDAINLCRLTSSMVSSPSPYGTESGR